MGGEAKPLRHHPALRRLGKRHLATLLGGVVALVVLAFAIARLSFAGDESYGDDEPAFGSFGSLRLGASDPARPRAENWLGDRAGSGAFASRMDRARSSIDALSLARDDDRAGGAGTQHPTPRGDRERRRGARDRDGPRGFPRAFEDDVPDDDDDDASGAAGTRDASDASSRARSSDVDHRGALALGGERLPTPLDLAPPSLSRRSTRVESSLDWMRSHLGGGARADARPARPPPVIEPIDFDADDAKDSAAGDARLATPFRSSSSDLIHAAGHHRASSSATPSSASSSSCARCGHRGACASPSTSSSSSSSACRCATAWEGRACRSPRSLGSHPPSFVASGYEVNGGAFALPELTLTRANAPDTLEVRLRRDDVAPARAGVVSASARARLPDVDPLEGRWFDSCAVVGGGGSLLGSGRGADIDAHAAVFRFGRAPTVGFERDAGSRTTHRVVDDASADFRESAGEVVLRIARSKRAFRDVFHQLALAKERAAAKTRGGVFARVSSYFGPYRPADDEENEGGGGAESSASSVSYALTPAFLAWLDDAFAFEPAPELVGVVVATLKCARVELFGFQMQSFDGVKDRYHEPDDDGSVFENEIPSVVGYEARGGAGGSGGAEGSEGGFASGFGGLGGSDPSDADSDASDADSNEPVAWPTKSAMDGNEFAVLKAMASRGFVGFAEPCVVRCHEGAKSCDACLAADAELAADDDAAGEAEGGSGGGASKRGVFGGPRFGGGARGIGDRVAGWMTEVGDALSHSLGERRGDGNGGDAAEFVEFWRRGGGARGQGVEDRGEKKPGFGDEDGFEAFEDVNGDSYGEDPGLEDAEPTTRADETTLFARGAGDGGKLRESLTPRRAGGAFRGYE